MTKVSVVVFRILRSAATKNLPSVGISLGESGSDLFQTSTPLRNNLSIFWEVGNLTQYAKNLLMVMSDPLLLVMSMLSSLAGRFVKALSATDGQVNSDGATDVAVGEGVFVGVKVGVKVGVRVGVLVIVLVGRGVLVGFFVTVAERVGFLEGVVLGSTTAV